MDEVEFKLDGARQVVGVLVLVVEEGPRSFTLVGDFEEIRVDRHSPGAGVLLGPARQWAAKAA